VTSDPAPPVEEASARDRRTGWLLVLGQFCLLVLIVALPSQNTWTVPTGIARAADVAALLGIGIMLVGASALGRGLTATPLPNEHARLRTGGLYRFVRHPIYGGLLLFALARAVPSGNVWTSAACAALLVLINGKARWEEGHLAQRFPDYGDYRERTPRFIPRPNRNRRSRPNVTVR
jgi:protein-S-isoprenylcysteine O-methyltransferase Ste14